MRVSLIVILTLSVVAVVLEHPSSTPAKQSTARGGTVTQQSDTELLVQIEKDLFKAKMTNNPEVIEKVLAHDWVNFKPIGRGWGKPELMEHVRQHAGELSPISGQQQGLQVFVFGNTAVATYVEEDTAKPDLYMPWGTQTDATDVFVKEGGNWKLKLSRGSPHFQK